MSLCAGFCERDQMTSRRDTRKLAPRGTLKGPTGVPREPLWKITELATLFGVSVKAVSSALALSTRRGLPTPQPQLRAGASSNPAGYGSVNYYGLREMQRFWKAHKERELNAS